MITIGDSLFLIGVFAIGFINGVVWTIQILEDRKK